MSLSEAEMLKVGADLDTAVQLPPESGGGYLAYLESQHHIHCIVSNSPIMSRF